MDAQSYFDSQAHFNKWLKQLTEDEQRMVVDMLNEFRQQNLQQCNVSGSLLQSLHKDLKGFQDMGFLTPDAKTGLGIAIEQVERYMSGELEARQQ